MNNSEDFRNVKQGRAIPSENGYCDQASLVAMRSGAWVCSITNGVGLEGAAGEYVSILRSTDQGKTWTQPVHLEDGPWESAYSALVVADNNRLFCLYNCNVCHLSAEEAGFRRMDFGDAFCFRYSDDEGVHWSERYEIPIRDFAIDRSPEGHLPDGRKYRFFWNVSRPFFHGDTLYCALAKVAFAQWMSKKGACGSVERNEIVLLRARDLATNPNATWETLPEGEVGIRPPKGGGNVAEEPFFVRLSDGTLYCVGRTGDGYPVAALSHDGGMHFAPSFYPCHSDGRRIRHPRACAPIWKLGNGRYLHWFCNIRQAGYGFRNPVWACPAWEVFEEGGCTLAFGEPELLFYHRSEKFNITYPDLLVTDGRYYVTESQKQRICLHEIPAAFIDAMFEAPALDRTALWRGEGAIAPVVLAEQDMDAPEDWRRIKTKGITLLLRVEPVAPGVVLLHARDGNQGGIELRVTAEGMLEAIVANKNASVLLEGSMNLADGCAHEIALVLDRQALICWFVVDGHMDCGGERFDCGWRWIPEQLDSIGGCASPKVWKDVTWIELYDIPLMNVCIGAYFAQTANARGSTNPERSDERVDMNP
ncbi:MAG: sialidase family protein [Eubacteriales bacterium]|nr:sialidase family protein [Eubacteriales bacterium]